MAVIVVILAAIGWRLWTGKVSNGAAAKPSQTWPSIATTLPTTPTGLDSMVPAPKIPPTVSTLGEQAPKKVDLHSPQATVQTQLDLLHGGSDEAFRATFLPSVQPSLTPDAIAACRRRVEHVPVRPDWEKAELSTGSAGRVLRVSMFGKSETGFHETAGQWLADAAWCVPIW